MSESKQALVLLDSYTVQQDLRIRLPRCVEDNLGVRRGTTRFDIYLDVEGGVLVLKPRSADHAAAGESNE